jgi:membrane-bound inhibitor of C-type lysozyme
MRRMFAAGTMLLAVSLALPAISAGQSRVQVAYACAGGRRVDVTYGPGWADVAFGKRSSRLNLLTSGPARRYGDGRWVWQTAGPGGTLAAGGTVVAANCLSRQSGPVAPIRARYACSNGMMVAAVYRGNAADVTFGGRRYAMYQTMSADGVRYAGAGLVWWTKGRDAFLSTSGGRMLARSCHASSL